MSEAKRVADSLAVKMKGFARDVYAGMTTKTLKDVEEQLVKKGTTLEKVYGNKIAASTAYAIQQTKPGYKAGNFVGGGIRDTVKDYSKAKATYAKKKAEGVVGEELVKFTPSITTALKNGHSTFDEAGKRVGYNKAAIAGTAVAGSLAGRVVTGGGLYRDRYGNVNVPGVPFI